MTRLIRLLLVRHRLRHRKGRIPQRGAGFTLIEVLVALLVLLIGLTGLLSMQTTALRANAFSRHANEASSLAEAKVEELRLEDQSLLVGGAELMIDEMGVVGGGIYNRTWTVVIDPGVDLALNTADDPGYLTLTVIVAWSERGDTTRPFDITVATQRPIE